MVENNPIGVVGDRFLGELGRATKTSFAYGSGVGIVQRHHPRRAVGDLAGQAGAGLDDHLIEQSADPVYLAQRLSRSAADRRVGSSGQGSPGTATARASSAAVNSARVASWPVMASTSALASSLRRRSHTATS
jgi:hypothetical protein